LEPLKGSAVPSFVSDFRALRNTPVRTLVVEEDPSSAKRNSKGSAARRRRADSKVALGKADAQQTARLAPRIRAADSVAQRNRYRAKASSRAADNLAALAVPLDVLIAKIGSLNFRQRRGIANIITQASLDRHQSGSRKAPEEIPDGVLELSSR
jgi:hypothetical protein